MHVCSCANTHIHTYVTIGEKERGGFFFFSKPTDLRKKIIDPNYHGQSNYSKQLTETSFFFNVYIACVSLKVGFKRSSLEMMR